MIRKIVCPVIDICNATGHPCCKITAGSAKDDGDASGHVFAPVITNTFNNNIGARIADTEPFASTAIEISFATSCAKTRNIADNR